jgi:thiol-disulfide isomerase/thioredoxin
MRHSFFALLVITVTLTACKVPKDLAADQDNIPDVQKNAIEERRKMQAIEVDEPMEDQANMDHKNDEPMEDMEEKEMDTEVAAEGSYTAYTDGVIGNGKTSVLFFHATWCPACKKNNGLLESWYNAEQFPRSVYKIDFDTATELRKQYGVNGQDTFVLIDGSGNEIERVSFPAQSALRALLG